MRIKLPSQQELNDRFIYRNGELYHKGLYEHLEKHYPTDLLGNTPTEIQLPVVTLQENQRYKVIWLDNNNVCVHRIVYKMFTGEEPETVDHKDGNTHNNKIENLTRATQQQNLCNRPAFKTNKLGLKNISQKISKRTGKSRFSVKIDTNKKRTYKSFSDLKDAIEFRNSKLKEIHGEFARHE